MTAARRHVIVAVGLAFEARIVGGGETVRICRGSGEALAARLAAAASPGCLGVVSFGIAGGLDPILRPGALVVASSVTDGRTAYPADPAWARRLFAMCGAEAFGPVFGGDGPLARRRAKYDALKSFGALAADMESHVVAHFAAMRKLPFAALRAVADPADRDVPDCALAGMRPDGRIDVAAVLGALARRPRELPGLLRVARDTARARRALARARRRLGRGFGVDLG